MCKKLVLLKITSTHPKLTGGGGTCFPINVFIGKVPLTSYNEVCDHFKLTSHWLPRTASHSPDYQHCSSFSGMSRIRYFSVSLCLHLCISLPVRWYCWDVVVVVVVMCFGGGTRACAGGSGGRAHPNVYCSHTKQNKPIIALAYSPNGSLTKHPTHHAGHRPSSAAASLAH